MKNKGSRLRSGLELKIDSFSPCCDNDNEAAHSEGKISKIHDLTEIIKSVLTAKCTLVLVRNLKILIRYLSICGRKI